MYELLLKEPLFYLQLDVEVYDSSNPLTKAKVTIPTEIIRNPNTPVFNPNSDITKIVLENRPAGYCFHTFTATDADGDKVRYDFKGTSTTVKGLNYFMINYKTGQVCIKTSPSSDPKRDSSYVVSIAL
jgi:hypothetical protein